MPQLPHPLYVTYLNRDYNEGVHVGRSERDAALQFSIDFGVGISPLKGVDADFWDRIDAAYSGGNWKGASLYKIEGTDPAELQSLDRPLISAADLNMAVIDAPLNENPAEPIVLILMNQNFSESAAICADRSAAARKLVEVMGLTVDDIGDEDDFEMAVWSAYEAGGWKGLMVIEIDPQTLDCTPLSPDQLGFRMEDLETSVARDVAAPGNM